MPTPIAIRQVRKSFPSPGGGAAVAVDSVSLDVQPGELFFLLGPSGCGKTTLLRMIAGFIDPDSGRILFGDRDVTHVAANKRDAGMVFQSYALWPHMTVAENIAFGLDVRKIKGEDRKRRVAEALAQVRMEPYAARKPNQLSGGQQQRIALARAIVIRPAVLLLDEPLSNLDARLRIELRSEIRRICKESRITTVYVTHDQKEALSMADRIAIMESGRLVQVGDPESLYRRPASRFVAEFLGETNFLEARVSEVKDNIAALEAAAGSFAADLAGREASPGDRFTCSIRPEAVRVERDGDGLHATLLDSIYLGEIAQHLVELRGGERLKAAEFNPADIGRRLKPGDPVRLRIHPADITLLPTDQHP